MADKLERIYTVPLGKAYDVVRAKRTRRAVKLLREFAGKHMKAEEVLISNALNSYLWERGIKKPPRKVKVRLIKEDGTVRAYLADEKIEAPKKEEKKEEKPKEAPKKPEAEEKKEELKKEQIQKSETARAEKEAEKAMEKEKAKIEIAEKKKIAHGKPSG